MYLNPAICNENLTIYESDHDYGDEMSEHDNYDNDENNHDRYLMIMLMPIIMTTKMMIMMIRVEGAS